MRERQDTSDNSATLGQQIMGWVSERPFENPLPTGKVEEGSARMSEYELVPALPVAGPERSYSDACLRSVQEVTTGNGPPSSLRKSRSIRIQVKSRSNRRSRGSVRLRFK